MLISYVFICFEICLILGIFTLYYFLELSGRHMKKQAWMAADKGAMK